MRALIAFAITFILAAAATAQERGRPSPDAERENLERWNRLSPEEQHRIRENHDKWMRLSPDERETIRRRHEAFTEQQRRGLADTPPPERARIERLPPFERRREMRRVVEDRIRRMPEQLMKGLAPEERERLERLSPEARQDELHHLYLEKIERDQKRFLDKEVKARRLDDADRARILSLPPAARGHEIGRLKHKKECENDREFLRRHGFSDAERRRIESLPDIPRRREMEKLHKEDFLKNPKPWWNKLSPEERNRLEALSPFEFFNELRRFNPERRPHSRGDGPR